MKLPAIPLRIRRGTTAVLVTLLALFLAIPVDATASSRKSDRSVRSAGKSASRKKGLPRPNPRPRGPKPKPKGSNASVRAKKGPVRVASARKHRSRRGEPKRRADGVVREGELFGPPAPELIAAAYSAEPDDDPEMLDEAGDGETDETEAEPRWRAAASNLRAMLLKPVDAVERVVRRGKGRKGRGGTEPAQLSDDEVITLLRLRPIVPVDGVDRESLNDSFLAPRAPRRIHHAIDIHAPNGTPCLAAIDGVVAKLSQHHRGGTGVYIVDKSRRFSFYYAHLSAYAPGLTEGTRVRKGDVIGYVGTTGNARGRSPHLHFSVTTLQDGSHGRVLKKRATLNPYPILAFVH